MMNIDPQQVAAWLNARWKGEKICPICRSNDWAVSPEPVELRPFAGGGLRVGGPVYPLVSTTCNVCGHTLLFNAVIARLIRQEKQEVLSKPEPAPEHAPKKEEK